MRAGGVGVLATPLALGDRECPRSFVPRLVPRAARAQRLHQGETWRQIIGVDHERTPQKPLAFGRIAPDEARQTQEQRSLSGERVGEVRSQLERPIDLATKPTELPGAAKLTPSLRNNPPSAQNAAKWASASTSSATIASSACRRLSRSVAARADSSASSALSQRARAARDTGVPGGSAAHAGTASTAATTIHLVTARS